jgi:Spy/CpxP family protein refolding chaperone
MNKRNLALGISLALAIVLTSADTALAQQDTTSAVRRARMGAQLHRGARPGRAMMRGAAFGAQGRMGAGHLGARMLIGLKDELQLTDDQVGQLEKIHEGHRSLMQAQMQNMGELRESMREARQARDWEALEKAIDEGAKLHTGMAKGRLNVERQSLEVLNDEQRQKFETWQEGARLFRRQGLRHRQEMRGERMEQRPRRQGRGNPPGLER